MSEDERGEWVSRGTLHSMAVEKLKLEAKVKSLESQLAAYKADQQRILDALKNVDQELVKARRETEEQRGRADGLDKEAQHEHKAHLILAAKLAEAEQRAARYEEALTFVAAGKRSDGTYNRSREACELLAKDALSPIDPPLGQEPHTMDELFRDKHPSAQEEAE